MAARTETSDYAALRAALLARLASLDRLAIAFSGGVDSAVLLHAAHSVLGERAVALIADSPSLPREELTDARRLAERIGARLEILVTREGDDPRYRANLGDRCYFCKAALFDGMEGWARSNGFEHLAFGEITDDLLDERPGARAAAEFNVLAPLRTAGFSKDDVRRYARDAGLAVASKPASACLASRIPLGTEVTRERLARVEAAERALRSLGLSVLRVRDHGARARVEVGRAELERARSIEAHIRTAVLAAGFGGYELGTYLSPAERARSSARGS